MLEGSAKMGPIRLGLIGTGLATEKLHWPALARLRDRFDVVAFANRTRPKAERFAAYSGVSMAAYTADYQEILQRDDIDAVLISLPIPLNFPVTRQALAAGKDVICEKPAGVDLAEAQQFIALVASYPERTVLVAENWFYRDDLRWARSLLDDGAIGRLHLVSWRTVAQLIPRDGEFSSTPWRHDPGYDGGPHLDAGVHHMAQLRLLCGGVDCVSGEIQDVNPTHGGPSDLTLNLRFTSGAVGNYTASYPAAPTPGETSELRLYGTDATMIVGWNETRILRPDGTVETTRVLAADRGFFNEFLNFSDAVHGLAPLVGTTEQTVRNMAVVLGGLDSARRGETVRLDSGNSVGVPLWRPLGADDLFGERGPIVDRIQT